jgi:thymidylate synthase (FAD)
MDKTFEHLERASVPELDAILGSPIKVLDDGFIRVVDYMGNDAAIVQAARVSYGTGTKKTREDEGLIRYLLRNHHTSPFEMCEIKFHVRVPMDCWRQWIRHRTANVNEYSTRYSLAIDAAQQTEADQWRLQAETNRQGSSGTLQAENGALFTARENELHTLYRTIYKERIDAGIAREQARKDLPLCTYTEAYWKIDLHNLLHFLSLRMDSHAQLEIRSYANAIGHEIVRRWCPLVWNAFLDYELEAMELSRREILIIAKLQAGDSDGAWALATEYHMAPQRGEALKKNGEREALEAKLLKLGMRAPWLQE